MRRAWVVVFLIGCFADPKPPVEPRPPEPTVDDRPVPGRALRTPTPVSACDDDATGFDCVLATFTELRDRACACTPGDKLCTDAITADIQAWSQNLANTASKDHAPTPEQTQQMSAIANEFSNCFAKALTAPSPPTTP